MNAIPFKIVRNSKLLESSWYFPCPWRMAPPDRGWWKFCGFYHPILKAYFLIETRSVSDLCMDGAANPNWGLGSTDWYDWRNEDFDVPKQNDFIRISIHKSLPLPPASDAYSFEWRPPEEDGLECKNLTRHKFGGIPFALWATGEYRPKKLLLLLEAGFVTLIQFRGVCAFGDDEALHHSDWPFDERRLIVMHKPGTSEFAYAIPQ